MAALPQRSTQAADEPLGRQPVAIDKQSAMQKSPAERTRRGTARHHPRR
jgi:hypothetical protein